MTYNLSETDKISIERAQKSEEKLRFLDLYVNRFFNGDQTRIHEWWRTSNPLLGGVSPNEMIGMGFEDKLYAFVKQAEFHNDD